LTSLNVVGNLSVDTDTLKVDSTTNRVGIGRTDPQKSLEVLNTNKQMRLSYSKYIFGVSADVFSDLSTDSTGLLVLSGSGGKTKIDNNLQITGLTTGAALTTKYLALDSSNNVVLTSSAPAGIETRNRRVINSNTTLTEDDYYIGISASSGVLLTLIDASSLVNGQSFTIKDEEGTANLYTLEVRASGSQTIDGRNSIVLTSPFAAINIYTNGVDKFYIF
jgi:hypothetical protein